MGTQIIKKFLILTSASIFISGISYAQYSKQDIKDAKGIALCHCLGVMDARFDSLSTRNKDVSINYFIEFSNLSLYQILSIQKFVDQNIGSFIGFPKELDCNMIGYTCWKLYESNELDVFIKNMLRKKDTEKKE